MAGSASAMTARLGEAERGVMGEINTTPLIDVMLVLLVMLIITVPNQTDAVKVDLPIGPSVIVDRVKNVLTLTPDGSAAWNRQAVDDATLQRALIASARMDPAPELHFRPDPATRYVRVDEVLAMTKRADVKRMGFVGNEIYRDAF